MPGTAVVRRYSRSRSAETVEYRADGADETGSVVEAVRVVGTGAPREAATENWRGAIGRSSCVRIRRNKVVAAVG